MPRSKCCRAVCCSSLCGPANPTQRHLDNTSQSADKWLAAILDQLSTSSRRREEISKQLQNATQEHRTLARRKELLEKSIAKFEAELKQVSQKLTQSENLVKRIATEDSLLREKTSILADKRLAFERRLTQLDRIVDTKTTDAIAQAGVDKAVSPSASSLPISSVSETTTEAAGKQSPKADGDRQLTTTHAPPALRIRKKFERVKRRSSGGSW